MNYEDKIKFYEASKDRFIDKNPNLTDEQKTEVKDFFNKRNNLHGLIKDWAKDGTTFTYQQFYNIMLPYLDKEAIRQSMKIYFDNTKKLDDVEEIVVSNFFAKFPDEAKKINWTDFDGYTFEDFIEIMLPYQKDYLLPQEKFSDLVEGEDYIDLGEDESFRYYYVKTFKASYTLASNNVPPKTWTAELPYWYSKPNWINDYPREYVKTNKREGVFYGGAMWCISMHHTPTYWDSYTRDNAFIFALAKKNAEGKTSKEKKIAITVSRSSGRIIGFTNYGEDASFHSSVTNHVRSYLEKNEKFKEIFGIED